MALVGSYSVPGPSSSVTLSYQYTTVDELLTAIPDNTAGAIQAGDIRDSVYSLWQKVEQVSASSSATVSVTYDRTTPSTITSAIGGVLPGSTFSGSVQDALDRIFYPYISPGGSLTSWSQKEYGDSSGYNFSLSYTAVVNSNPLTSIIVNGTPKPLTPLSGTQPTSSTHSSVNPTSNPGTQQTYTMTISDGTSTTTKNTTITWRNRIFWGRINLSSIGNPNLTINPGSASTVSSFILSSTLLGLNGAAANGLAYGSELSTTKSKTYNNINGFDGLSGNHLIFAWPSNMSGAYTPTFTVNGLMSSAFTRVRNNWQFTNSFGFSGSDYEVWVSNTIQNSPLNIVIT
jgi:hypothetical protein